MNRLTIRNSDGTVSQPMNLNWAEALERLASFEDTKLTPEEIENLKQTVEAYATAARTISLYLDAFCDRSLRYDLMIADAARKAAEHLDQLKAIKEILGDDCDLEQLQELVKADREGRTKFQREEEHG